MWRSVASEALEEAVKFAAVVALADAGTLVVFVFTTAESNVKFSTTVGIDKQAQRYDGEAWRLAVLLQIAYLAAVEQQFAVATGGVVVVAAEIVGGNIHILHPHLAIVDEAECVDEGGLACTDALDLCAGEDNARGEAVDDMVFVLRTLVLNVDARRRQRCFLAHISLKLQKEGRSYSQMVLE